MRRYSHSRGFTLVELLVVIAIIGTLVALLLPAVQGARESARKASCSNNLHNLAIAAQQYHSSMGSYPSGWMCTVDPSGRNEYSGYAAPFVEGWGWGALLLPFLEQKALHTQLGVTGNPQSFNHASLSDRLADIGVNNDLLMLENVNTVIIKMYMCPSDTGFSGRGQVDSFRMFAGGVGGIASGAAPLSPGVSNYVGVAGHRFVSGTVRNTGVFYGNSYVRDSDIIDGLSNTAIFGERDTQICHSATWLGVENPAGLPGTGSSGFSMVAGYSYPKLNINIPDDPSTGNSIWMRGCGAGYSSNHPGGALFAFADGGVRFIVNGIEWRYLPVGGPAAVAPPGDELHHKLTNNGVYQAMMSINDKIPPGSLNN